MNLSKKTLEILANFAEIQPNFVFRPGSLVQTLHDSNTIMASATVAETFPEEAGVYNLVEFLETLTLVGEDAAFSFTKESVTIKSGSSTLVYRLSDPTILKTPKKTPTIPSADVIFQLSGAALISLKSAANKLKLPIIAVTSNSDGSIRADVSDPTNTGANSFSSVIGENKGELKTGFNFHFLVGNLKVLPGDYTVSVSKRLVSHWKHATLPVEYWVALEKSSTVTT